MFRTVSAALAAMSLGAAAHAIPPGVMNAYNAYMDAIEANDLRAAATHAEAAYQAGVSARIDAETLAALAENRAQIYTDTGDAARAGPAWNDVAGALAAAGADREDRARALVSAGTFFYAQDNAREGMRAADAALALYPEPAASPWLFRAHNLKANLEWRNGRIAPAGMAAIAALAVQEQIGPRVDREIVQTATLAAVGSSLTRNLEGTAFYVALASSVGGLAGVPEEEARLLATWRAYAQAALSEEQAGSLAERQSESALFRFDAPAFEPSGWADQAPGRVDAAVSRRFPPRVPPDLMREGVAGFVILQFDVSPGGRANNIRPLMVVPHEGFARIAEQALRRWEFTPATQDGQPVLRQDMVMHFDLGAPRR